MGEIKMRRRVASYIMIGIIVTSVIFGRVRKVDAGPMAGFEPQNMYNCTTRYTRALQIMLVNYNSATRSYIMQNGGIDGSFGTATYGAVYTFQSMTGLSPDGSCGPLTWAMLNSVLISLGLIDSYVCYKGQDQYAGTSCMKHTPNSTMTWFTYWSYYWYYVD